MAIAALVGAFVATPFAFATHGTYLDSIDYWIGYLSPAQYRTGPYDSTRCNIVVESTTADFSGYGWATVAIIDGSGGWRASATASTPVSRVAAFVYPQTLAGALAYNKKGYCANSGSGEQVLNMWCRDGVYRGYSHSTCI